MSALEWVRCKFCGRRLFRAAGLARVEIVCGNRDCKALQEVRVRTASHCASGR